MALVDKVGTGEVVSLDPGSLKYGPAIRRERISIDHVNRLRAVLDACPPIVVAHPRMTIVDGHHRVSAAGLERVAVRAVLVSLAEDEVFEAAVKANVTHGLTLTTEERKSNAAKMLKDSPDWSDRRIAEACGLSATTVGELRSKVGNRSPGQLPTSRRVGADNRKRPADPGAQRVTITAEISSDPEASDRQIAARTGASHRTVSAHRRRLAAVPDAPADAPPSVGELVVMAPVVWKDEKACQRTDATREFARFMDRFTRWNNTSFYEWVTKQAPECPADLRTEAASVARSMSAAWARLADELSKHNLTEAQ